MNPGALRQECSYLQDGFRDRWRVTQTVDNFISHFLLQTVESYQEAGLGEQLTHGHSRVVRVGGNHVLSSWFSEQMQYKFE